MGVFLLMGWLPFTIMAAASANTPAAVRAPALLAPVQNFPSTEPEFETLRDAESIDNQAITTLAQFTRDRARQARCRIMSFILWPKLLTDQSGPHAAQFIAPYGPGKRGDPFWRRCAELVGASLNLLYFTILNKLNIYKMSLKSCSATAFCAGMTGRRSEWLGSVSQIDYVGPLI